MIQKYFIAMWDIDINHMFYKLANTCIVDYNTIIGILLY